MKAETETAPGSDKEQENFIQRIIDSGANASVYLCNGVKLVGPIYKQSNYAIEMGGVGGKPDTTNLIYLHSVSTIQF